MGNIIGRMGRSGGGIVGRMGGSTSKILEQKINDLDDRVDTIITTPAEGVSAQEIIDARGGEATLGGAIREINVSLAQNTSQLAETAKSPMQYGAKGDGITDDTQFLQNALNDMKENEVLDFKNKKYKVSQLNLPNVKCFLKGENAQMIGTDSLSSVIFYQYNRVLTVISGFTFTNCKHAIKIVLPVTVVESFDYAITNCKFIGINGDGKYGIYLDGCREGYIKDCMADASSLLYMIRCVNTKVTDCEIERADYGINCDGDGTPYSCGPICIGITMINMVYGFRVSKSDHFSLDSCMMDFCQYPVTIITQDGGSVTKCYLTASADYPAISILQAIVAPFDGNMNNRIKIADNDIIVYGSLANTAIDVKGLNDGVFRHNYIHFYKEIGLAYSDMYTSLVEGNTFQGVGDFTRYCVKVKDGTDQSTNNFVNNNFYDEAFNRHQLFTVCNNQYLLAGSKVYKAKGVFTIPAGDSSVYVVFPRTFYDAPYDIKITFPESTYTVNVASISTVGMVIMINAQAATSLMGYYVAKHLFES